jgi:hypothetical protein
MNNFFEGLKNQISNSKGIVSLDTAFENADSQSSTSYEK